MRARFAVILAAALGTAAYVATNPLATASPPSAAEFEASLASAMDASGVFAPGRTFSVETSTGDTVRDGTNASTTVNSDGSLISRTGRPGHVTEIRCINSHRCWVHREEASPGTGWLLLPRSQHVHYAAVSSTTYGPQTHDLAGAAVDIGDIDGRGRVFTLTRPIEGAQSDADASVTVDTWIVEDSGFTHATAILLPGESEPTVVQRTSVQSLPSPVPIEVPDGDSLPELTSANIRVSVASCITLPARADCS